MHYRSHLSCHRPQRSMESFTNTELADIHQIYGLAEGNAPTTEILRTNGRTVAAALRGHWSSVHRVLKHDPYY
ncbi:hypothetical protein TNCV_2213931 [Trichonephila clavipes]|nr:hypothetical protein TNCV_2213931 [Trichonephila clavipes]